MAKKKAKKKASKKRSSRGLGMSGPVTLSLAAAPAANRFCNGNDKVWVIGDDDEYDVLRAAVTYWKGRAYLIGRIDYSACDTEPAWSMTTR